MKTKEKKKNKTKNKNEKHSFAREPGGLDTGNTKIVAHYFIPQFGQGFDVEVVTVVHPISHIRMEQ
jgi:hypothetical protein